MKKILCFMLTLLLVFNTTLSYTVYAIGSQPSQEEVEKFKQDALATGMWYEGDDGYLYPKDTAADKLRKFLEHGITVPKLAGEGAIKIAEVLSSFFGNADNYQKNVKTDGQYVYFDNDFTNNINIALQDKVHALDGYYLLEPANSDLFASIPAAQSFFMKYYENNSTEHELVSSSSFIPSLSEWYKKREYGVVFVPTDSTFPNVRTNNPVAIPSYNLGNDTLNYMFCDGSFLGVYKSDKDSYYNGGFCTFSVGSDLSYFSEGSLSGSSVIPFMKSFMSFAYGSPFKLFYSLQDVKNYLNKGRTYVPQLPSGGIKVNIKYINNTTNLPDITYNINTTNKTEVEIQNEYNTTLNNYLNDLNNFTDGSDNNPTPTPSGGGSGDFGDGSTPTPTPPLGDGSDQDGDGSDSWLKKIYDQLLKLSDSVSQHFEKEETFEDKLSKYLESHDKKLDAIVDAIDKLSQGKEEGEEKGCKYDYTELSGFMTKLWNDSDQKFDTMIDLLKENNAYQEKLVSTLNSIKNILKAQSIMDSFKNRSQETANKAKDKFPTSVPWDVAMVVNAMSADPKEPVFVLPVKVTRLGIDEEIKIDLSTGEWEKLAKACRYMLSLLFILFMVKLTIKLFGGKGDD